jgi:hypothetical protein
MLSSLRYIRAPLVILALLAICTLAAIDLGASSDDHAPVVNAASLANQAAEGGVLAGLEEGIGPAGEPDDFTQFCGLIAVLSLVMIAGLIHLQAIGMPGHVETQMVCLTPFGASSGAQAAPSALIEVAIQGDPPWVDVEGDLIYTTPGTLDTEGMGTVAGIPNVKATLDATIDGEGNIAGTYTLGPEGELPGGEAAVWEVNGQLGGEMPTPSPSPTASATPTSSPTATSSPTEPPAGQQVVWGDANCSGEANPIDSLLTLRFDAGLDTNTGDCPDLGAEVNIAFASLHIWGDVDCTDEANPIDSLKLLRFDAGLSVSQEDNCPEVGSEVQILGA